MSAVSPSDHHGGFDAAYFRTMGVAYDASRDFSVNVNPWGPGDGLALALRDLDYRAYPDPQNLPIREKVAQALGVDPAGIVVDAGSCRILWSIVQAHLRPGDVAAVVEPTFGEFHRAVAAQGAHVHRVWRSASAGWTLDVKALSDALTSSGARMLYLCDPNNPTGELLAADVVPHLAAQHPDVLILWDEAYRQLTRLPDSRGVPVGPNVVRLQSLTKEQGVPGLRIGYAEMSAARAQSLRAHRPSWCCGTAEEVGIAYAMAQRPALPAMVERWMAERDAMVTAARAVGLAVHVSDSPWFLIEGIDAQALRDHWVTRHGMLTRDCASFGMPDTLRVCPRSPAANSAWIEALTTTDVGAYRREPRGRP